jgi:hypothetical protein
LSISSITSTNSFFSFARFFGSFSVNKKRLDELVDQCFQKRAKRTSGVNDAVYLLYVGEEVVGTAFVIDDTHVLTARHNIFNDDEVHYERRDVAISDTSSNDSFIPLRIISTPNPLFNHDEQKHDSISNENDWVILQRTDIDGKFYSFLAIQPSTEKQIAFRRPYITIYHFAQRLEKSNKHYLMASENRLIGADYFELKCNDSSLISKDSCGGPYVDNSSKAVLGFHIAGASSYEGNAKEKLVEAVN